MFTGIVEEIGKVENIKRGTASSVITIRADKVLNGTNIGDSIAVNGVCLTVVGVFDNMFRADIMAETLRHSNLNYIKKGGFVNLERAMSLERRFGGHIVTGHIDDMGILAGKTKEDNAVWAEIKSGPDILRYIVYKGSVALDGVSLTVAEVSKGSFSVSLIPHTRQETALLDKEIGSKINVECDIIGKYVEKLLSFNSNQVSESKIDMTFLQKNGFIGN